MRLIFLPVFSLLASCATFHSVPSGMNRKHAIEYCGGELWGYFRPIGPREDKGFWTRTLEDPKPLMAVFLHMHSVLEKDPEHSLTLHFALRSREDLSVQFPDPIFAVQNDVGTEKKFRAEFSLVEDALRPNQLYPNSSYEIKLVDPLTNKWSVAKRNGVFAFITDKPRILELPVSTARKLSVEPVSVKFDGKKFEQIFVLASVNIWPESQPLRDSRIVVRVPVFLVNGVSYGPQTFVFETNYQKVRTVRSSYGRCPSVEEIFRYND